jgi:hypothetical protein
MKHTAVRWLELMLIWDPISEEEFEHNMKCWKQAKEKEKEQIIDFARNIIIDATCSVEGYVTTEKDIEEYYNETFKTNEK